MDLTERKKEILKEIVFEFIKNKHPVSSSLVAQKLSFNICSATARREMAELEKMGYLTHTHTSSGKIPTDKGLRFFVDSIKEIENQLTLEEKNWIRKEIANIVKNDTEYIILRIAKILSSLTYCTSIISMPTFYSGTFKFIELIPLSKTDVFVIVGTTTGYIEKKIISVSSIITSPYILHSISKILSNKLHGKNLREIKTFMLNQLEDEIYFYTKIFKEIISDLIKKIFLTKSIPKVYFDGISNIIQQIEFKELYKMQMFLKFFEREDIYSEIFSEVSTSSDAIKIKIGEENEISEIKECSLLYTSYKIGQELTGEVGLLGPKNMHYCRAISAINYVTESLKKISCNF